MGQQETAGISTPQFGHDCVFGTHDLEGSHVSYQGMLHCMIARAHVNSAIVSPAPVHASTELMNWNLHRTVGISSCRCSFGIDGTCLSTW